LFGLLFIIYQAILIPFRLCFDVDATGGILYVEDIMDVTFMMDIIVTFNTGFYKKGYLVMKRKDIIKNYLKTWFWIDLVATFPYSWVMGVQADASGN
jgi:CRP-like cAMP-binding protein